MGSNHAFAQFYSFIRAFRLLQFCAQSASSSHFQWHKTHHAARKSRWQELKRAKAWFDPFDGRLPMISHSRQRHSFHRAQTRSTTRCVKNERGDKSAVLAAAEPDKPGTRIGLVRIEQRMFDFLENGAGHRVEFWQTSRGLQSQI